ncbi:hypothetical protein B0H19DRAFT_1202960 [Mycena capillaripes]|nr:hypothetical protein B0H19DRAFT_1202960 [Mycena capillaripes]
MTKKTVTSMARTLSVPFSSFLTPALALMITTKGHQVKFLCFSSYSRCLVWSDKSKCFRPQKFNACLAFPGLVQSTSTSASSSRPDLSPQKKNGTRIEAPPKSVTSIVPQMRQNPSSI